MACLDSDSPRLAMRRKRRAEEEILLSREVHRPQLLQLMAPAAFTPQKIARSSSPRFAFDAFSRHGVSLGGLRISCRT
jgi:hypothetical protein